MNKMRALTLAEPHQSLAPPKRTSFPRCVDQQEHQSRRSEMFSNGRIVSSCFYPSLSSPYIFSPSLSRYLHPPIFRTVVGARRCLLLFSSLFVVTKRNDRLWHKRTSAQANGRSTSRASLRGSFACSLTHSLTHSVGRSNLGISELTEQSSPCNSLEAAPSRNKIRTMKRKTSNNVVVECTCHVLDSCLVSTSFFRLRKQRLRLRSYAERRNGQMDRPSERASKQASNRPRRRPLQI